MNTDNHKITGQSEKINDQLKYLKLGFMRENYEPLAKKAAQDNWTHFDYLDTLVQGEAQQRMDMSIQRRVSLARFPQIKTLDQFRWNWPKKINEIQIKNLFRLKFIGEKGNVIFLGGVGTGKTHLAISLGYTACLKTHSVLFTTAVDIINNLSAAQSMGRLKYELNKYIKPSLLICDEIGYLPIDKTGADLLFQVISQRYERGSMIITSNRAYKDWPKTFNNDSTLTSAILDRVLHHAETVIIEGKSYRMKEEIDI